MINTDKTPAFYFAKTQVNKLDLTSPIEDCSQAIMLLKPFKFIRGFGTEEQTKFQGRDADNTFYLLQKYLAHIGIKITDIDEKLLPWKISQRFGTGDIYFMNGSPESPYYSQLYEGVWRLLRLQRNNHNGNLQEDLNLIKGPARNLQEVDEDVDLSKTPFELSIKVKPLRAMLGDRRIMGSYPYDAIHRVPVRYNAIHIPDHKVEARRDLDIWNSI